MPNLHRAKPLQGLALARLLQPHPEMTALLKTFRIDHKINYWPYDVVENPVVSEAYNGSSNGEKMVIEFLLSPLGDYRQSAGRER